MGRPETEMSRFVHDTMAMALAYYGSKRNGLSMHEFGAEYHITRKSPMRGGMTAQTVLIIVPANKIYGPCDGIIIYPFLTWTFFDNVEEAFPDRAREPNHYPLYRSIGGSAFKACWVWELGDPALYEEASELIDHILKIHKRHSFTGCDTCGSTCKMRETGCDQSSGERGKREVRVSPEEYRAAHKKEHFTKCQARPSTIS